MAATTQELVGKKIDGNAIIQRIDIRLQFSSITFIDNEIGRKKADMLIATLAALETMKSHLSDFYGLEVSGFSVQQNFPYTGAISIILSHSTRRA